MNLNQSHNVDANEWSSTFQLVSIETPISTTEDKKLPMKTTTTTTTTSFDEGEDSEDNSIQLMKCNYDTACWKRQHIEGRWSNSCSSSNNSNRTGLNENHVGPRITTTSSSSSSLPPFRHSLTPTNGSPCFVTKVRRYTFSEPSTCSMDPNYHQPMSQPNDWSINRPIRRISNDSSISSSHSRRNHTSCNADPTKDQSILSDELLKTDAVLPIPTYITFVSYHQTTDPWNHDFSCGNSRRESINNRRCTCTPNDEIARPPKYPIRTPEMDLIHK
jgi:hypothetical protein